MYTFSLPYAGALLSYLFILPRFVGGNMLQSLEAFAAVCWKKRRKAKRQRKGAVFDVIAKRYEVHRKRLVHGSGLVSL